MAWESGRKNPTNDYVISGFRQELSYSGIDKGVILISYREFSVGIQGAYARPAFSQELRYDLSSSKTITFREVRIEVDTATSEKIRYKVLSGPSIAAGFADVDKIGMKLTRSGAVSYLDKDGAAAKAGMMLGDIVLQVDNTDVRNIRGDSILQMIISDKSGRVYLLVDRSGRELTMKVATK